MIVSGFRPDLGRMSGIRPIFGGSAGRSGDVDRGVVEADGQQALPRRTGDRNPDTTKQK
jgi:hypothetical protein